MSARYNGLQFKTHLEAQWAAFFDLAGWSFWVNPVSVGGWQPDFKITFPCTHSECGGSHTLFAAILDCESLDAFGDHPSLRHAYGLKSESGDWLADGGAAFGSNPRVSRWVISHGAGGGEEDVFSRESNADRLWLRAGQIVGS